MAVSVINDDKNKVKYKADDSVLAVLEGIMKMNDYELEGSNELNFINSIIREVEGVQGHREAFKSYKVFANDDGSFAFDSKHFDEQVHFEESYAQWCFTRKGYVVKDSEFTHKFLNEIDERKLDAVKIVKNKMNVIHEFYTKHYIPNKLYQTLFEAPIYTVEGERNYYGKPFGFLRGEHLHDASIVEVYARGNLERNHYRAIKSKNGVITKLDLLSICEYLSQYIDINNEDIVLQANRKQFNKILCFLDIAYNTLEDNNYIEIGKKIKIVVNDYFPNDWVFASNKKSKDIITKLVSPNERYRGMAIVKEKGFAKLEDLYDLIGSNFKIIAEGYHLTGRHQGCFLYTGVHNVCNSDGEATVPLKDDVDSEKIMNTLKDHVSVLKNAWYKGVL